MNEPTRYGCSIVLRVVLAAMACVIALDVALAMPLTGVYIPPPDQRCDHYHYAEDDGRLIVIHPCDMQPTALELARAEDLVDRAWMGAEEISPERWRERWKRDPPYVGGAALMLGAYSAVIVSPSPLVEPEDCSWPYRWDEDLAGCVQEVTEPHRPGHFLRVLDGDGDEIGLFEAED